MAVKQANQRYSRSRLKQLNNFASSQTGSSAICDDTIRRWWKEGDNLAIMCEVHAEVQ